MSASGPSGPLVLMLWHHETMHTGNFHRKGCLMLHHLVGATIQVAKLVSYICHSSSKMAQTMIIFLSISFNS